MDYLAKRLTLIIMPTTEKITHVVVVDEYYPETRYLVPVERIVESTPGSIRLSCTRAEVSKMPVFNKVEFIPSAAKGEIVRVYDVALLLLQKPLPSE